MKAARPRTRRRTPRAASSVTGYFAECFWPGVTETDLTKLDARVRALDRTSRRTRVRYTGALLIPRDEVVFCFFSGPSADAVRAAATRAGIPFERILESVRIGRRPLAAQGK